MTRNCDTSTVIITVNQHQHGQHEHHGQHGQQHHHKAEQLHLQKSQYAGFGAFDASTRRLPSSIRCASKLNRCEIKCTIPTILTNNNNNKPKLFSSNRASYFICNRDHNRLFKSGRTGFAFGFAAVVVDDDDGGVTNESSDKRSVFVVVDVVVAFDDGFVSALKSMSNKLFDVLLGTAKKKSVELIVVLFSNDNNNDNQRMKLRVISYSTRRWHCCLTTTMMMRRPMMLTMMRIDCEQCSSLEQPIKKNTKHTKQTITILNKTKQERLNYRRSGVVDHNARRRT